ncbi:HAMP domain-containing sensor histidine kinase [Deinococcus maricopensis]|uniref:histidine kinase n=1 Tax=Deinococcus maricopensis (strain DSM 21211 / LMG 22137 / NRRL B-23946 / LB-34) TaxID=709986 RepID=E8U7V4_DEIML|nr:HAMP domain-containing sensor histidine kinase [Deinococcus maricopensis]ADV67143.1 integral membrane sensor signal transduction histidine kinase [Deinococcus maricopensis DSM 21211]
MTRRHATLRVRLAALTAAVSLAAVLLVTLALAAVVQRFVQDAQVARLASAASTIRERIETALAYGPLDLNATRGNDIPAEFGVRVTLAGTSLAQTQAFPNGVPEDLTPGAYRVNGQLAYVRTLSSRGALLVLATENRAATDTRAALTRALALTLPVALPLVALFAWLAAGRMLRPIKTLEQAARDIGESGDLTRPVPGAGPHDELARLAATLQTTFAQLAATREREVTFLRAAAHDLRTPLAALRARVTLALARDRDAQRYRADLQEVGTDLARLTRLAEHLLLLARNPSTLTLAPLDLHDLAADAVDTARTHHPDRDIDLTGPGTRARGDRILLTQAVTNLLENAARHAPNAAILVTVGAEGSRTFIRVHDDGPGVPPEVLARLGEAFYRPDAARAGEGHGLGLAIARHVAQLHGGALELHSGVEQGFTATLRLPDAGAPH